MSEVTQLPEPGLFGDCPECGRNDGYLNIYQDHWFVCHRHKTRWYAGWKLFSSWKYESEEDWTANEMRIVGYREVEPWIRLPVPEPAKEPPKPPRASARDDIDGAPSGSGTIKIRIEDHPDFTHEHENCVFCGGTPWTRDATSLEDLVPVAELPTGGSGEVCYDCIKAGPEGMKDRIKAHAERLRAWAAQFERWARGDIRAPSIEDVRKMKRFGAIDSS